MSHLCADYGSFFPTVNASFLYYLTDTCTAGRAFLVGIGPTPGLRGGVETGTPVALVREI